MSVEIVGPFQHNDVLVRGRRVPMLSAVESDGGRITLVFDRRLGLELDAGNYERVIEFVADVMENCLHPDIGRIFNAVHEITGVSTAEDGAA